MLKLFGRDCGHQTGKGVRVSGQADSPPIRTAFPVVPRGVDPAYEVTDAV